jgi:plastocyanin
MKKIIALALIVLLAVFMLGCVQEVEEQEPQRMIIKNVGANSATNGATILIQNGHFSPAMVTINKGDYVEWVNIDDSINQTGHTVTFDRFIFDEHLPLSGSISHQFTLPGRYIFYDRYNLEMEGIIIVR